MGKVNYKGHVFDSPEECEFFEYLEELRIAGFIHKWERGSSMEIIPKVDGTYNGKKRNILRSLSYTPDFSIYWYKSAKGVFYNEWPELGLPFMADNFHTDRHCSVVDVKGAFAGRGNSTGIKFPVLQKVLCEKGWYIHKIVPKTLFWESFTPKACQVTPTGKKRKLPFTVRSLEEYVHDKRNNVFVPSKLGSKTVRRSKKSDD